MINRRGIAVAGRAGVVLGLALLAQRELEQPEPSLLTALALFVVAGGFLLLPKSKLYWLAYAQRHVAAPLLLSAAAFVVTLAIHLQRNDSPLLTTIAWLISIIAFLLGCWEIDLQREPLKRLNLVWTQTDTLLVSLVFIVAVLLRVVRLSAAPATMNGDEGSMGMEAVRVIRGEITDPFTTGWLSHPTMWFFLQSFSLRLFGDGLSGLRILSALIGSITVVSTYVLTKLLYTRRIAAIAAAVLATYHFHIHFSRLALNNIADPLFGTVILICLTWGWQTQRWLVYGLTGVALGLSQYFYFGARLFVPLLLVLSGLQFMRSWRGWRMTQEVGSWGPALIVTSGAVVIAGPLLQTFVAHPQNYNTRFAVEGVTREWLTKEVEQRGRTPQAILLDQFQRAALAFNRYPDRSPFYDNQRPLLSGLAAALMVLGFILALSSSRCWRYQIPVVWFSLAIIFGGALFRAPPQSPRYVTLAPVVCLFIAFAVEWMVRQVQRVLPRQRLLHGLTVAGVVLYLGTVSVNMYFRDYLKREAIGGANTHAANALATYLKTQPPGTKVWFFGAPRMFYHGFQLLDFLARDVDAEDVIDPIKQVADVPLADPARPTVYAVLPEREAELQIIQQRYPEGTTRSLTWRSNERLLYVYTITDQAAQR